MVLFEVFRNFPDGSPFPHIPEFPLLEAIFNLLSSLTKN
jgi:hypothetical protein